VISVKHWQFSAAAVIAASLASDQAMQWFAVGRSSWWWTRRCHGHRKCRAVCKRAILSLLTSAKSQRSGRWPTTKWTHGSRRRAGKLSAPHTITTRLYRWAMIKRYTNLQILHFTLQPSQQFFLLEQSYTARVQTPIFYWHSCGLEAK